MKKKLTKIANQIIELEKRLQIGESMNENMAKLEELTSSLSPDEFWEINEYLESKLGINIDNK